MAKRHKDIIFLLSKRELGLAANIGVAPVLITSVLSRPDDSGLRMPPNAATSVPLGESSRPHTRVAFLPCQAHYRKNKDLRSSHPR